MPVYKSFPCKFGCGVFIHFGQDPTTDKWVAYEEDGVHHCKLKPKVKITQNAPAPAPAEDHFGLGGIEAKGKKLPNIKPTPIDELTPEDRDILATIGIKYKPEMAPADLWQMLLKALVRITVRMQDVETRLVEIEEVFGRDSK